MALDAQKVFDSVEWNYLYAVLDNFGMSEVFVGWVHLLYNSPKAKVSTNGWISEASALGHGKRQGCPLSPLLYALATEPLAARIRQDPRIRELMVASVEEKISLGTDDMILFLADSGPSLDTSLSIITKSGYYSSLSIYFTKSQLFPIGCTSSHSLLPQNFPIPTITKFKYLGIIITLSRCFYNRKY